MELISWKNSSGRMFVEEEIKRLCSDPTQAELLRKKIEVLSNYSIAQLRKAGPSANITKLSGPPVFRRFKLMEFRMRIGKWRHRFLGVVQGEVFIAFVYTVKDDERLDKNALANVRTRAEAFWESVV